MGIPVSQKPRTPEEKTTVDIKRKRPTCPYWKRTLGNHPSIVGRSRKRRFRTRSTNVSSMMRHRLGGEGRRRGRVRVQINDVSKDYKKLPRRTPRVLWSWLVLLLYFQNWEKERENIIPFLLGRKLTEVF